MPYTMKTSWTTRMVRMLTKSKRPASCSLEGNKVSTFDKLIYDYTLNGCEHVIFRDCTDSPKMMVTVKKTSAQHIVKAVIDGNMYELEIIKATRGSRTNVGVVKVNGQVKQASPKVQGRIIKYEDAFNEIFLFDDGVYEISSLMYGLTVRADSHTTQVETFQGGLKNLACGLCGDLNGE